MVLEVRVVVTLGWRTGGLGGLFWGGGCLICALGTWVCSVFERS